MSTTTDAIIERIATQLQNGDEPELPLADLTVRGLALVIVADWGERVYFGAVPYLDAMLDLETIDDAYGADRGRDVVAYFLSNASTWRGPVARAVKAELKRRLGR